MGRRSLPKLDRSVAIDDHFSLLESLSPPWSPETHFGRNGQLEIEIGSGKGLFLLNASEQNPERLFLGVEISGKYAAFSAHRFAKHGRDNARIIHGDAIRFMHELVADQSVHAVHVYFPDPWWKERHRRRRVIGETLVKDIQRVLVPAGVLHFWTDVEEYFESGCQTIVANSSLQGPLSVPEEPADHDMDFRTHFERRMRINGHPVFRSRFINSR